MFQKVNFLKVSIFISKISGTKQSMEPDGVWPEVEESFFRTIWRDRLPFLKCRTFHKFSKSDVCGLFNEM